MGQKFVTSVSEQSLRPLTQALVGALEVTLKEIAALHNYE
jgi:hypothetical protein